MKRLTSSQIEEIQRATEDVLANVCVRVMHDGLLQRARGEGRSTSQGEYEA
jgi:trimethylamine:corrinoid methyltransferase-like protein